MYQEISIECNKQKWINKKSNRSTIDLQSNISKEFLLYFEIIFRYYWARTLYTLSEQIVCFVLILQFFWVCTGIHFLTYRPLFFITMRWSRQILYLNIYFCLFILFRLFSSHANRWLNYDCFFIKKKSMPWIFSFYFWYCNPCRRSITKDYMINQ